MNDTPPPSPGPPQRHWSQGLRPLWWWVLLVLVLFGIRTHQRLSEQTHLNFSVSLQNRPISDEASAELDGQRVDSGARVSVGWHKFTVSHPKAVPFTTNLFIWYRENKLGAIALQRGMGFLVVDAHPPARLLTIYGPEFSLILTNSSGTRSSVPTDTYAIQATYAHWGQADEIAVLAGATSTHRIAPRLGWIHLECSHPEATFELLASDSRLMEAGKFPALVLEVLEGNYTLNALHHGNRMEQQLTVKPGTTNTVRIEFVYGAAVFETEPSGATVASGDGSEWGVTPLSLTELKPGAWAFNLHRAGYEPVQVSLQIAAHETKTFHTNLVSRDYSGAMNAARQYFAAADYDRASEAALDALRVKPEDAPAAKLQREATGLGSLRRAEMFGKQTNYTAGIKELEAALKAMPERADVQTLLVDFKKNEANRLEQWRQDRLTLGTNVFTVFLRRYQDVDLFDSHELKTTKPVNQVKIAILEALKLQPAFKVTGFKANAPETFLIEAVQEFTTVLATIAGRRQCLIVGAQTRDDETEIHFKVLEYKSEAVEKFSIGNLIGAPGNVRYVPIHPSRVGKLSEKLEAQLKEGVSNVTARIQQAIGQTP